jgi:hypothetical protein
MAEDVRACGYVVGEADVAVAVEGDEVHGPGVQIDATALQRIGEATAGLWWFNISSRVSRPLSCVVRPRSCNVTLR